MIPILTVYACIIGPFCLLLLYIIYRVYKDNQKQENTPILSVEPDNPQLNFRHIIDDYEAKRQEYYLGVILNLMEGSAKQFSGVITLDYKSYGYYLHEDVMIWWDNKMCEELLKHDIASYQGSGKHLIITIDKDRVNNLKNKL